MPRQSRLDAPGLLQHVMARGIERRKIFLDDKDRRSFLDRLAVILEETQTQCYAWALIPNHFHLFLRTGPTELSKVMRRLMTGYAVTFNKRHKRSGHLFQNRYKSIICEEDPYLLELVRYVHLNPLRAKLVQDLNELDKYPWAGHSAILGNGKNPLAPPEQAKELNKRKEPNEPTKSLAEKTIEDVLLHFGETQKVARRRYRDFVEKGIPQGRRPELQGGGLVRSAGGNKAGLLGRKADEREKGDARILGSGDFVGNILSEADKGLEYKFIKRIPLPELVARISNHLETDKNEVLCGNRKAKNCEARALVSFFAAKKMGYRFNDVAETLGIHPVTAGRCAEKGKKLVDNDDGIWDMLEKRS
ncbi:MAG: transposase [Deltaproteobacteria bacterium]|nr:transposase [Deltaproteobacteria bacterium]